MSERNNFEIRLKSAEQYGQTLQRQYDCSSANVVSPAEIIDVQSKSPDEELLELKLTNQELNREMEELKIQRKEIKLNLTSKSFADHFFQIAQTCTGRQYYC